MVTVLKYGATKQRMQSILKRIMNSNKSKGIDAYKYCGSVKLKKDPVAIQKLLRDEWK